MIVGITGTIKAGKGNIVKALKENGFEHHSVRGFLLEEIAKRNQKDTTRTCAPPSRDSFVAVANELRANHGPNYIVHQLLQRVQGKDAIIESIRNPGEVELLRQTPDAYLVSIDAPIKDRHARMLKSSEGVDRKNFDEFKADEQREMESEDPNKQQIANCISMADYHFWSDYDKGWIARGEFVEGKTGFLNLWGKNKRRPTLDEMFMRHASEWALRSTCLRRRTGAVVVRPGSKTPVTQGYNGPATGVIHCADRGGCIRAIKDIPLGEGLDKCPAVHAETNAILKGAKEGISLDGAIMYATTKPCKDCANAIAQAGIKEVIYQGDYPSKITDRIIEETELIATRYRHGVTPHAFPKFFG